MFSRLSITKTTLNLSSANAINLDWSKNLSFGKGLIYHRGVTLYQTAKFRLFQTEGLQTTILNLIKMAENSLRFQNTVGKGDCLIRAISPFHTVFFKDLY